VRRLSAWLVAVPLMLAGTEAAHALAYRIVYPQASVRWRVLAETGHGYLGWLPVLFGLGAAVALAGIGTAALDVVRRRPLRPVPPWAFFLLPLLAFTLQEFVERWLMLGGFPWWMVEQPTFRVGALLQLPCGFLAYLAARLLFRVAERIGSVLWPAGRASLVIESQTWTPIAIAARRVSVIASGCAVRGPPVPLLAR